jgi:hypothetical protein
VPASISAFISEEIRVVPMFSGADTTYNFPSFPTIISDLNTLKPVANFLNLLNVEIGFKLPFPNLSQMENKMNDKQKELLEDIQLKKLNTFEKDSIRFETRNCESINIINCIDKIDFNEKTLIINWTTPNKFKEKKKTEITIYPLEKFFKK